MVDYDGRFVWYELMTTDMGVARAFYAKVMGWGAQDLSVPGLPYTLFTTGGASAAGLMSLPEQAKQTGANPMWIGYVGVNDVDATADRIMRLGGTVPFPPTDILDYSRFAVVTDAQLATLALIKWLTPARHHPAKPGQLGASAGMSCSPPMWRRHLHSTTTFSTGRKWMPTSVRETRINCFPPERSRSVVCLPNQYRSRLHSGFIISTPATSTRPPSA